MRIVSDACWIWPLGKFSAGYGCMHDKENKAVYVHRWVYEHFVGPIPKNLQLDHLCRTPACFNPQHLEPVTCRTNLMRGIKARQEDLEVAQDLLRLENELGQWLKEHAI